MTNPIQEIKDKSAALAQEALLALERDRLERLELAKLKGAIDEIHKRQLTDILKDRIDERLDGEVDRLLREQTAQIQKEIEETQNETTFLG